MEFSFLEAFLIGTFYWFTWMDFWLAPLASCMTWQDSCLIGLVLGLAYGNVEQGLILGGSIGLIYIGVNYVGANVGSDVSLACCVAIPLSLKFGWDINVSMVVATAFGLFGTFLDTARRLLNGYWHRDAERRIKKRAYGGLWIDASVGPWLVDYVVRAIPLMLVIYFGGSTMDTLVSKMPEWVMNGFTVVGGLLPALGLILCCAFIGRKELYPFFIIGYYLNTLLGWTSLTVLVFAVIFAIFYLRFTEKGETVNEPFNINLKQLTKIDTTKSNLRLGDHWRVWWRTLIWFRVSQSMEYFFGVGYMFIMKPALEKIYKDDPDGLQDALMRHLCPFITEPCMGACIHGLAIAMEEQKARGEEIAGEDIVTMKTSLMGPFAGLGDSIFWTTTLAIVKSVFIPFAVAGHWYGAIGVFLLCCVAQTIGWFSHLIGYNLGGQSIIEFLQKGIFQKILLGVSVVGFTMMGVLTAGNAHITCVVQLTEEYTLQNVLDNALPGVLMMLFCWFGFRYMSKGGKFLRMLTTTIVAGLVLGFLGILG